MISLVLAWLVLMPKLKPETQVILSFSEPSDLSFRSSTKTLYGVSDAGQVYEFNLEGKTIRKSTFEGGDLEGIAVGPDGVYVVDERFRKVTLLDSNSLLPLKSWTLQHQGARNSGYEGIVWDEKEGVFWLVTEKNPILLERYDRNFNLIDSKTWNGLTDVSAITLHQGQLWLLSDEDRQVVVIDKRNWSTQNEFKIKATTPEGICFLSDGRMAVVNDDSGVLSFFKLNL